MNFDIVTPTPIELSRAEALVIFDWLGHREDAGTMPGDDAEQIALNNLLGALEKTLVEPFQADYNEIVQAAKNAQPR